nr:RNA methyltransferase [Bacteroidota bacterium]
MDKNRKSELFEYLVSFISANRRKKFENVIQSRTRYVTVVLEDLYQSHNASAVLRSCDCFGIQDVHIIENQNYFELNEDIALGSSKWLNLIKYNGKPNNTSDAINKLKKKGYRIVATTPHKDDVTLQELPVDKGPIALVFGTEMRGLTDDALSLADEYMKIPMYGFTESFNISVTVALCLFYLSEKIRNSKIKWQLPDEEKIETLIDWARTTIKRCDLLEEEFYRKCR